MHGEVAKLVQWYVTNGNHVYSAKDNAMFASSIASDIQIRGYEEPCSKYGDSLNTIALAYRYLPISRPLFATEEICNRGPMPLGWQASDQSA